MTDTNQLTAREIEAILTLFNHFNSYEIQEITGLDLCEISTLFDKLNDWNPQRVSFHGWTNRHDSSCDAR